MSESTSRPAPISASDMSRIEQDAKRGIGASSGDTIRLVGELSRYVRDPVVVESTMVNAIFDVTEDYIADNTTLEAENYRLRALLAEKVVTSTMLTGLVPEDGGMTVGFEGGACGMLAQVFGDQFYQNKAINYLELRFNSAKHPELGPLVVTLQRVEGKTPHQLREVAEAQNRTLTEQVAVLQSDANSWQSGYDEGRRMGSKTMQEARTVDARLAGFWNSLKETPPVGVPLVVLRDAGNVGNGQHPGHRCGRWLELTAIQGTMFLCDAFSTGHVMGWVRADEFLGLEAMRKEAELYRFVSRLAWYVDKASFVYDIGNNRSNWATERQSVDADEVEAAITATMNKETEV
jgi:hypothetical protein